MQPLYQDYQSFLFSKRSQRLDFAPHLHEAVEIFFFTRGSSTVLCGSERFRLGAGDVFVAFPNRIHGYEHSENIEGYIFIIPVKPYLQPYRSVLMNQLPEKPFLSAEQWQNTGLLPLLELAYRDRKQASQQVMQGYLQVIVGKLLSLLSLTQAPAEGDDALKQVLMYLNTHYTANVSRGELARELGYSESYISHLFTGTMRTTIPEYVSSLRVQDAERLLLQTDYSVTQIASELGFGSIRSFNRVFLKQTGFSPKEYRQNKKRATIR